VLVSCATPAQRAARFARDSGFSEQVVHGTQWEHVVFSTASARPSQRVHVYVEGDGTPWIAHRWVARDPTPRKPIMLTLMAMDTQPSIYLGRPCYFGLAEQSGCEPWLWTDGRYSEAVVSSMVRALEGVLNKQEPPEALYWFGHSGGGTLAMLLAERFPQSASIVTLAGNLDVEAWARHHGYTPLSRSLNPASRPPLPSQIRQIHLIGTQDLNVPIEILESAVAKQHNVEVRQYPDFDHACCWRRIWRSILEGL
jgi:hypothetical protein